jgi:nicotinamide mononucleotide (NMN) deamidase PncC
LNQLIGLVALLAVALATAGPAAPKGKTGCDEFGKICIRFPNIFCGIKSAVCSKRLTFVCNL